MAIFSLAGTTVSIGTSAAIDFSSEAAAKVDFADDTYLVIAECETISDFGDTAADVPFTSLTDARTRHLKGSTDGGTVQVTCAEVSTDAGQAAVKAASAAGLQTERNVRIAWANGDVGYVRGPVMGWSRVNGTGPDNVMKRQFTVSNNYGEIVVLAS